MRASASQNDHAKHTLDQLVNFSFHYIQLLPDVGVDGPLLGVEMDVRLRMPEGLPPQWVDIVESVQVLL